MLLAVCHSKDAGWKRVEDLGTLSDLRNQAGNLLWAETDVRDLTHEDIQTIAGEFDLHPLAVEDAGAAKQRPKLERYEEHYFLVLHQLDVEDGQLEPSQLACFVGERFVLTIHHGAGRMIEEAKKRWEKRESMAEGPYHLIHTLLDVIVDDDQAHADRLELEVEQLEDLALSDTDTPLQRQLYSVKQQLARLRRFALPIERAVKELQHPHGPVSEDLTTLFRDVEDHTVRIGEQIRSVDDLSQAVLDLTYAEQAERLNENSQRLAAWAAIFAVSTVVAGIYGMNFELVPDENSLLGFFFALGLMLALGVGLHTYFRRKGWL